jgi:hypothetical protein
MLSVLDECKEDTALDNIIHHAYNNSSRPLCGMLDAADQFLKKLWAAWFQIDETPALNMPFSMARARDAILELNSEWLPLDLPNQAGVQFVYHSTHACIERTVTMFANQTLTIQARGRPVLQPALKGIVIDDVPHLMDILRRVRQAPMCHGVTDDTSGAGTSSASLSLRNPHLLAHSTTCWNLVPCGRCVFLAERYLCPTHCTYHTIQHNVISTSVYHANGIA